MAQQEHRAWFMVASLFLVLLLIAGSGANTFGVFLPTLLKAFPHELLPKVVDQVRE